MEKEIKNEVRVIDKLGANGCHQNIVTVFSHGWLNDRYYFDMELCIFNLEDYILSNARETFGLSRYFSPSAMDDHLGCLSLWGIMTQITNGLVYIHSQRELHRDLKPRNSMFLNLSSLILSPPISSRRHVENHRFRSQRRRNFQANLLYPLC